MRHHLLLTAFGLGVLSIAATARPAHACGGCFQPPSETQNGDVITDEKMIFVITPQSTTLFDEIEYSGNPSQFGWVLPIKGPVTVGLSSDALFQSLENATATTIVAPPLPSCPSCQCAFQGGASAGGSGGSSGGSSGGGSGGGVTVISQQTVGPYDTVQLQSTNPQALNQWLTANGYVVPNGFQPVISEYVNEAFDFLALKLVPGQGVSAMRPVRVTTPGAGLSLPLRMVGAGTGAQVGVTVWVIADGRYEPQNMKQFTIDPSSLVWDWSQETSNLATLRQAAESADGFAAWQIESSIDVLPYQVENPLMLQPASDNYPVDTSGDAGDAGETSDQAEQADLDTMFPGGAQSSVRITRMRADLSHSALANDLYVQASADQSQLSNVYPVTKSINAPTCPAVPDPCPPCDPGAGGSSGGSSGGASSGGLFGQGGGGSTSANGGGGGCATASNDEGTNEGLGLALAGLAAVVVIGKRVRRRSGS
jgi:MYXO-CTERM domain-containing protein